jgi:hypothetical protein
MTDDLLKTRSKDYGNFHTLANLSQTLNSIIAQHYNNVQQQEFTPMPHFMAEALQMICHKISRIVNGNIYYDDSWKDIAGYAQLVVDILEKAQTAEKTNELNNTEKAEET